MKLIKVVLDPEVYPFLIRMEIKEVQELIVSAVGSRSFGGRKEMLCPWFPYPHPETSLPPDMTYIEYGGGDMVQIRMVWREEEVGFTVERRFVSEL